MQWNIDEPYKSLKSEGLLVPCSISNYKIQMAEDGEHDYEPSGSTKAGNF